MAPHGGNERPARECQMRTKSTPEDYYAELGRVCGPDLVVFVHWAVDNAPAHGLCVVWGCSGPLLKYVPEKRTYLSLTLGQLDPVRGVISLVRMNLGVYGRWGNGVGGSFGSKTRKCLW